MLADTTLVDEFSSVAFRIDVANWATRRETNTVNSLDFVAKGYETTASVSVVAIELLC